MARKIRILIAKPGLDGHDRGAQLLARSLRDAGMEVIYTGLHQVPEQIVKTAIQEGVDVIGLSILSGNHMNIFQAVATLIEERNVKDIIIIGGGIIPPEDVIAIKERGWAQELFAPGTDIEEIINWIKDKTQIVGRP